ncbi:DUF2188 domain-containing protein [Cupriavidus pauculus]|uniref:DUF2188 domain-containing protein n=1 Tax=Cupriavidus pauculus TaxID=82633 RepID=A0A2N5CDI5_9BURK|nr:DUF2188 domain-containing protein [Cupriavidus pauculus]PLQ00276.1 hypothetical protein CYJ10_11495 [Cupriavidus pauculus]
MASNIHVVPTERNGWAVEEEGSAGPAKLYNTQEEAIAAGTERAKADKVELLIHGFDGRILARTDFGHKPRTFGTK